MSLILVLFYLYSLIQLKKVTSSNK